MEKGYQSRVKKWFKMDIEEDIDQNKLNEEFVAGECAKCNCRDCYGCAFQ